MSILDQRWSELERGVGHGIAVSWKLRDLLAQLPSWTGHLSPEDRAGFAEEFSQTFLACAELDDWEDLTHVLTAWHTTADICAHPVSP